jgi:hypothetical protein
MTKTPEDSNQDKQKRRSRKEDYGSKMRKLVTEREQKAHRVMKKAAKRKK